MNFAKAIGPDYWEKRKNVFDFKQGVDSFLNCGRMPLYVGANSVTFKGAALKGPADKLHRQGCRNIADQIRRRESGGSRSDRESLWPRTRRLSGRGV